MSHASTSAMAPTSGTAPAGGANALFARLSLLILNVTLFGLGIALAVMGSNKEGTAGLVKNIYAKDGFSFSAFQEPDYAMAVVGAFVTITSLQGIVGACTGNKKTLFAYHTMCLFLITGVIYAAEMTRIYRDEADATVEAYWSRLDPHDMSAKDDNLVNYSESHTKHVAKRWFTDANGILISMAVFLAFSLVTSGSVMGLKYTLKRVGAGANFMGIMFGFFLLVLCVVVARATYTVPDALSIDVSVNFPAVDGKAGEPVENFLKLLHDEPWKIFRDDAAGGSGRPHGVDSVPSPPVSNETGTSGRRLLPFNNATSPPPPPAPMPPPSPPPWNNQFPARAMWINHVDRRRRTKLGELQSTVVHFTASFSGVNATEDIDLNATLPRAVEERVKRTAVDEDEVLATNLRRGGTHSVGGAWAAQLLAAAGVLVMLASIAGFVGITTGVTSHLWIHFAFAFITWCFAITAAHKLLEHSDDTKMYLRRNWQVIQTGVVGDNIAAEDAAAFATQHMRAAAALGALCVVMLSISLASTAVALLLIYGWIGPAAHRRGHPLFRGTASASNGALDGPGTISNRGPSHRRLTSQDDEWGDDGWGDGWDDDDDKKTRTKNVRGHTQVGSDIEGSSGNPYKPSGASNGDAVVEMSDLHNMVAEARGGRGRFKNRGGKSSRTPSPERGKSAAVPASVAVQKMEEGLLSLFARVKGGVKSAASSFSAGKSQNMGGGSSVFRDEIAQPGHSRAEVAAAVSMLRAAAARRNPDDPDAALMAALEVAGEGDASLIREALGRGAGGSPRFTLE